MPRLARRSFFQTAASGAAILAFGVAVTRPTQAAEGLADVKFAQDPQHLQAGLEAAHTPRIVIEKVASQSVAYGKTPAGEFYRVTVQARHEATAPHHILGLALYRNGKLVAEHQLNPGEAEASLPTASFTQRLQAGDQLLAVSSCNLHGKWGSRTTV